MPSSPTFHESGAVLDPAADRARLLALLIQRSLRFGSFLLASGGTSSFYIDVRKTSLDSEGATLLGRILFAAWEDDIVAGRLRAVGGLTLGADPLVLALALEAYRRGYRLDAFLVRKAVKEHGTENLIEGNLEPETDVLIVDDVCTRGESTLLAVEAARRAGARVAFAWCAVDREAGGRERLASHGVSLVSCFDVETLLAAAPGGEEALAEYRRTQP